MGSFEASVDKWIDSTEKKLDQAKRKIALDILRRVVLRTPVDTGRARANWNVSVGHPDTSVTDAEPGEAGATTVALNQATMKLAGHTKGRTIFLTNNVPYIEALENGHSGQAPAGMVKVTLKELPTVIRRSAG